MTSCLHLKNMITTISVNQLDNNSVFCYPDYTILCLLEGAFKISLNNTSLLSLVNSGVVLLPPYEQPKFEASAPFTCLIIRLKPIFLLELYYNDNIFSISYDSISIPALNQALPDLFLLSEMYFNNADAKLEYQIIGQLFFCMDKLNAAIGDTLPSSSQHDEADASESHRNKEILNYLAKHIRNPLSLQNSAHDLGLTPQYLSFYFQKNYGCTFMEYISKKKATLARLWILHTPLTDSDIASAIGFKTTTALQKSIQAFFNLTTNDLRCSKQTFDCICELSIETLDNTFLSKNKSSTYWKNPTVNMAPPATSDIYLQNILPQIPQSWKSILNVGHAFHLSDSNLRKQLREIQNLFHFKYGRICRILDLVTSRKINDEYFYGFDVIFQIVDLMVSLDLIPFLEIGNKNTKVNYQFSESYILSSNEDTRIYYTKAIKILPEFIKSCCNRYGQEAVQKWHFEIHYDSISESDTKFTFWQYLACYKRLEGIIHTYLPTCKVGGPGFNTYVSDKELSRILNSFTSQNIRIDFFSIYVYGCEGKNAQAHLSKDRDITTTRTNNAVRLIREYTNAIPVLVTEFNFCYASRNFLNDTIFQGAFLTRYLIQNLENVDGMGYFVMSDVSTRHTDSEGLFFGGNGLFNYLGIQKPSFYAYSFFNKLGIYLLAKSENYIITSNSRYEFQGLFTHYTHITDKAAHSVRNEGLLTSSEPFFEASEPKNMQFCVHGAIPGIYIAKTYRIEKNAGNILAYWAKCPDISDLTKKEIEFFKDLSTPSADLHSIEVAKNGVLEFSVSIKSLETLLILINYNAPSPSNL